MSEIDTNESCPHCAVRGCEGECRQLDGMTEDRCRHCGALIGYDYPPLHVGICSRPQCQVRARTSGKRRARRHFRHRKL